jgi:hypothetical protein
MPLTKEFLGTAIEGITDEQAEKILKEYDSDMTGIKVNRDTILTESRGYKDKLDKLTQDFGTKETGFQKQIEDLENKLKASGSDDLKAFHEAELKKTHEMYAAKLADFETKTGQQVEQYNKLHSEYLEVLKNTELDKSMDKIQNLDRAKANILRDTFWARNKFEHQEVDGTRKLLNQEFRSISDVLNAFIATDEGKMFVHNNSTGGGAPGGSASRPSIANPWLKDTFNLTQQMIMEKENPTLAASLRAAAGAKN